MNYIRGETFSRNRNKTLGGFIGAAYAILYMKLGIDPTASDTELADRLSSTKDLDALDIWHCIVNLSDMQQPEVYVNDRENHICMYTENRFEEDIALLVNLDEHLNEATDGKLRLVYANLDLENDEILYNDNEQIVISRDAYESRKEGLEYNSIENVA
jgi:hypothetical protein